MTKLDWDKLRRNDRVAHPVPGSSSDTIRPVAPRRDLSPAEISQLAAEGRELLQVGLDPKSWLKRYNKFERKAHFWSAYPELSDIYAAIRRRHSEEHRLLATRGSSESIRRLSDRITRLESLVSDARFRDVNVDTLVSCHEMFERLRASVSHSRRLELLLRFRRLVGAVGVEKVNHFISKGSSGTLLDSYTVFRWLRITSLYAPAGHVGESLKELAERLRKQAGL